MQKFELRVSNTRYTIIHYAGHTMGNGLVLPFADSDVDTREFIRIVNQNPPTLLVMDACNSLGDPEELDLATPLLIDSGAVFAVGTRCLVPECGGISQTDPSIREALWDRYSTAAPRPRTRSELQYSDRRLRSKSWPPSTV
jgi:hypothetical protein